MKNQLKKEIKNIIKSKNFNCSIEEFKYYVNWVRISLFQKLSEDFMKEFKDNLDWFYISKYQKLSESFIKEFKDDVDWLRISKYQKLSEDFIREFKDKVDWDKISASQKLSEDFIREFKDMVNWDFISLFQNLSKPFIMEFKLKISDNNMRYWTNERKLELLKTYNLYEIKGNKIIAFKGIRDDRYSKFNFQYQYLKGKIYESHCDYNNDNENSFGLSAWIEEEAKRYCDELVIKVEIDIADLGAIVHNGGKLRCSKFKVLS